MHTNAPFRSSLLFIIRLRIARIFLILRHNSERICGQPEPRANERKVQVVCALRSAAAVRALEDGVDVLALGIVLAAEGGELLARAVDDAVERVRRIPARRNERREI